MFSVVALTVGILVAATATVYAVRQFGASKNRAQIEKDRRQDQLGAAAQGPPQAGSAADVTVQLLTPLTAHPPSKFTTPGPERQRSSS
jgi:hypothetical protein